MVYRYWITRNSNWINVYNFAGQVMPKPSKSESKTEFIKGCMGHPHIKSDFDSIDKRLGKCYGIFREWKRQNKKKLSQR